MKLDHLYSLRTEFTIIGLTGRTGSGCSTAAELLSGSFEKLCSKGVRDPKLFTDKVFQQKFQICKNYLSYGNNWIPFETIRYKDVLLFYILHKYGGDLKSIQKLLIKFYKKDNLPSNIKAIKKMVKGIKRIDNKHQALITKIKSIFNLKNLKTDSDLINLNTIFFGKEYRNVSKAIFEILENNGYVERTHLLHHIACNIRNTGDPLMAEGSEVENIFSIAEVINRLIKARTLYNSNNGRPTKIVIDSLRNSLEIMFFKERFSAFYMIACKDVLGNAREQIYNRLSKKIKGKSKLEDVISHLFRLDSIEYRISDFSKGTFSSPDVENCIQKSDYHLVNLKRSQLRNFTEETDRFLTREEQLMKLIALIQQPGIITPSSMERAMQIANTAKLNSGCISRKVGAVITNSQYFVQSVGWNDVAKGHTPCNLRSVTDFFVSRVSLERNSHYSDFEKGLAYETATYAYKEKHPRNFKGAIESYFKESYKKRKDDLNGKNCSFCFKSIHNHYEGKANQVHTRSLHAEENAMLQITSHGGTGANNGYLFTTASPCELCSKKAYQLGIKKIYFIDPYPGIAIDQILKGGLIEKRPILIPFSGAIGNAYHELYESFLSYKDEITMTLELEPK